SAVAPTTVMSRSRPGRRSAAMKGWAVAPMTAQYADIDPPSLRAPSAGTKVPPRCRPHRLWSVRLGTSGASAESGPRDRMDPTSTTDAEMTMIEVNGLTKRYGKTLAVDRLSFRVEPGVVTGFVGPNGAGKSTTMRMVLGLDRPTAGTATVAGRPSHRLVHPLRQVGALLDASAVHPRR